MPFEPEIPKSLMSEAVIGFESVLDLSGNAQH
jgi:hypothetical protein